MTFAALLSSIPGQCLLPVSPACVVYSFTEPLQHCIRPQSLPDRLHRAKCLPYLEGSQTDCTELSAFHIWKVPERLYRVCPLTVLLSCMCVITNLTFFIEHLELLAFGDSPEPTEQRKGSAQDEITLQNSISPLAARYAWLVGY